MKKLEIKNISLKWIIGGASLFAAGAFAEFSMFYMAIACSVFSFAVAVEG